MSGFIEKLSNKFQGKDAEQAGQYASDAHDTYKDYQKSGKTGNTRSGRQNFSSKDDQQFSTGSGTNDQYAFEQTHSQGFDDGQHARSQGRSDVNGLQDDNMGTGMYQESPDLASRNRGTSGQDFSSGGAYGTQEESMGSSGLGSGRQTRSQASHGSHQESGGGQQGYFSQQAEELGRKGFERGVQEGQKYVSRNL